MLCLKASLRGEQSHKNLGIRTSATQYFDQHQFFYVRLIHEFPVLKLRIEMNVSDSTHSVHCEFFSCKTENHIILDELLLLRWQFRTLLGMPLLEMKITY